MKFSQAIFATLLLSLEGFRTADAFSPSFPRSNAPASATALGSSMSTSNVVLAPTEEDQKKEEDVSKIFDSLTIGGCHVHRYKSTSFNTDDTDVNYVMWYHGRSDEQDKDENLPPLSTGRIGRATSKNGLVWEKDTKGSSDADIEGVSLGLNEESWWGFDTAHVGLGSVLLPMTTPAVMTEGGIYLMYYFGGSYEETKINQYTTADLPDDLKVQGMNMKIGVAVSQDGETWGRVEGDDPTGACMVPYNTDDPNTVEMAQMKDDDNKTPVTLKEEMYCGWPEVVVKIDEKKAENSGFFMYYSTMTKEDKQKCLGVAVSSDGFRWYKRGICLEPSEDEDSLEDGGVARCSVFRNAEFSKLEQTWSDAPGYTMLYEGVSTLDN